MKASALCVYNIGMEVYFLDLAPLRGRLAEAMERLGPERRARAVRLLREDARLRSVGAGLLLARFFPGREPLFAPGGKPYFPGGRCLSLSHSGEAAVIALDDTDVGVDVQRLVSPRPALLRRVLTPGELAALPTLGEDGFTVLWTRKEAVLKCLGVGMAGAFDSFSVLPGEPAVFGGAAFSLCSLRRGDCVISTASAAGDARFALRELRAEELLG